MSDRGPLFFIGATLFIVAIVCALVLLGALLVTFGYNTCSLYEFFGTDKLSFEQAIGVTFLGLLFAGATGSSYSR